MLMDHELKILGKAKGMILLSRFDMTCCHTADYNPYKLRISALLHSTSLSLQSVPLVHITSLYDGIQYDGIETREYYIVVVLTL